MTVCGWLLRQVSNRWQNSIQLFYAKLYRSHSQLIPVITSLFLFNASATQKRGSPQLPLFLFPSLRSVVVAQLNKPTVALELSSLKY
jgi:hypothetical protein